jgi:hypothetical protein
MTATDFTREPTGRPAENAATSCVGDAVEADARPFVCGTDRDRRVEPSSFSVVGRPDERLAPFVRQLSAVFRREGFRHTFAGADAGFVVNVIDPAKPRPFRRHSRGTYVVALALLPAQPVDGLRETYPLLVRALANIVLCYIPGVGVSFTTMERGNYIVSADSDARLARLVADRLLPLAGARLVIDNTFVRDLEHELWHGDDCTAQIAAAGRRLDRLGLLPAPFPIDELVPERDLRHIRRLYGIGGLSYGNLSVRQNASRFWMSASGVDKGTLAEPNRDILLVTDFDSAHNRMLISVPPWADPRRVSVDAVEHWAIYRAHPGVEAILHIHAWIDGIAATEINFPCGTAELAEAVAALIAAEPDPDHAVIGLKNHGITATGDSLDEILDRIEPQLLHQVPMS